MSSGRSRRWSRLIAAGVAATLPLLWVGVPQGQATADNMVPNPNFELGNTGFDSDYVYCPGPATGCGSQWGMPEGKYGVEADPTAVHGGFAGEDHTTGTGKFMVINGATATNQAVWRSDGGGSGMPVAAGEEYRFEAWIRSLVPVPQYAPPQLRFEVGYAENGGTTAPTSWTTLAVPGSYGSADWTNAYADWTAPNDGRVWLRLMNNATAYLGNDFGLDDVWFSAKDRAPSVADDDADGTVNGLDAFPNDPTEDTDTDRDGTGDNADAFPNDPTEDTDTDSDGTGDNADAFPNDPTEDTDTDSDGTGDNADNCVTDPNPGQADDDGDQIGNTCDADRDGDGIDNAQDALPDDRRDFKDSDGDGIGDSVDTDRDGDGVANADDTYPDDPARQSDPAPETESPSTPGTTPRSPRARTALRVAAKPQTVRLTMGRSTRVVTGLDTAGSRTVKAHCRVNGTKNSRACTITVNRRTGSVIVQPTCSTGVTAHVRVTAKHGDLRATSWSRSWRVERTPGGVCTQPANG